MGSPFRISVARKPLVDAEKTLTGWAVDDDACRNLPSFKALLAEQIEPAIQSCSVIFTNLKRENFDSAICYSAPPFGQWHQTGYVVVVFAQLDTELQEMVVFDWELRVADPQHPGLPLGWETDFGEPTWP